MLLRVLDALPSQRAFTVKALQDVWNGSRSAYRIGPYDDLHSASDGIFFMISSRLSQANVLSDYRVAYQCPHCQLIDNVSHVSFDIIPQLHIPDQTTPVSFFALLDTFLANRVDVSCSRCAGPATGSVIPHFGTLTPICFNRRPDFIPGVQQMKIATKLMITESSPTHDLGQLIAVINHRGGLDRGHWMCYTRVNNGWFLHDDSHPMEFSPYHPFNSPDPMETTNFVLYYKR